jgi:hypothetical protein
MKKLLLALPIVLWIAWVVVFHVTGGSIWGGFSIAFFSSLGMAKITGAI